MWRREVSLVASTLAGAVTATMVSTLTLVARGTTVSTSSSNSVVVLLLIITGNQGPGKDMIGNLLLISGLVELGHSLSNDSSLLVLLHADGASFLITRVINKGNLGKGSKDSLDGLTVNSSTSTLEGDDVSRLVVRDLEGLIGLGLTGLILGTVVTLVC